MFCCYVFNKPTLFYIISIKVAIPVSICPLSVLEKSTTKIVLYINYRTFLICPFLYMFLNKKEPYKRKTLYIRLNYLLLIAACAAASLAIGTLNGEQLT